MITSCDQCRQQLAEYALGGADAAHSAEVASHLAACPACRAELTELHAAWSLMPLALKPIGPSRELFDQVLARIDDHRYDPDGRTIALPGRRERWLSYGFAAAVLVALTAAFWTLANPTGGDDEAARRSAEKLAQRLGNLQEMERLLAAENVRVVALTQGNAESPHEAYIVWDLAAGQWHFYASDLPAPPAGRAYQIWIVDNSGQHYAGPTFAPNDDGLGSAVVDMPKLGVRSIAKAVVTLEDAGGAKQPTGKTYLEAAL